MQEDFFPLSREEKDSLAYAAGLFDGEGYIGLQRSYGSYLLSAVVNQTPNGLPSLELMQRLFGGVIKFRKSKNENEQDQYCWRVHANQARIMLRQLIPYLLTKRAQAEAVLKIGYSEADYVQLRVMKGLKRNLKLVSNA